MMKLRTLLVLFSLLALFTAATTLYAEVGARETMIDGVYIQAFSIVFAEHVRMPDLTERQKRVNGYRVVFTEDDTSIVIVLVPKVRPNTRTFGGDTPDGRSARYTLDKRTLVVMKRELFR